MYDDEEALLEISELDNGNFAITLPFLDKFYVEASTKEGVLWQAEAELKSWIEAWEKRPWRGD